MSSKGATVTVLYPRKDGATFNSEYYNSTHMPLVAKHWGPLGLKSYSVTEFGPDAPYSVQALMEWESIEAFGKAAQGEHTAEIMGDITNFSSEQPVLLPGAVVSRG